MENHAIFAMTPQERRGYRLFLFFGILIMADRLFECGGALVRNGGNFEGWRLAFRAICLPLCLIYLWHGESWMRWLAGAACIVQGGLIAAVSGMLVAMLAEVRAGLPPLPILKALAPVFGLYAAYALFYIVAGAVFLLSPAMKAFLAHRRFAVKITAIRREFGIGSDDC